MKKIIAISTPLAAVLTLAPSALAATQLQTCATGFTALCSLGVANFGKLVGTLIQFIFVVAVVAALLYLIYGGFKWLTSGGDKNAVSGARDHIIAAIIGLVIIFLSYFIINLLMGFFNIGTLNNISIPSL